MLLPPMGLRWADDRDVLRKARRSSARDWTPGPRLELEITGRFRAGDIRHCFADISLARAELGFEPRVALEDGIDEVIAFVREATAVDRVEQATAELAQRGLIR